jgi:hypothetical protein
MTYDAVTIYTFAMFSLLSGSVVCTKPTELEEIEVRYNDLIKILGKKEPVELVVPEESYQPNYPESKWPWATNYDGYLQELHRLVDTLPEVKVADLQVFTMTAILANEEIETKYRLSKVRPTLLSTCLLPF